MSQPTNPPPDHHGVETDDPRVRYGGQYVDVMHKAAYRHRWVIAWRALVAEDPSQPRRFEPVRLASLESYANGETLTDQQIAHQVRQLATPIPPRG